MHKEVFTERELIEMFDGSEFETKVWKDKGYLKNNGTLKKLIKKAETKYHEVVVVGSGSKRTYECSYPKEVVTTIEDKRKNNKGVTPTESSIMTGYIFNRLKTVIGKEGSWSHTKRNWIDLMDLIDMNPNDTAKLTEELEELYLPFHKSINIASMRRESVQNVEKRMYDVFDKAMTDLVTSGHIKIEDDYKSKLTDEQFKHDSHLANIQGDTASNFKDLSELQIETIREAEREELVQFGVEYNDYFMARVFPRLASQKAKDTLNHMDEMLEEEFGIEFYYKSIRITILKHKRMKVTDKEGRKAFSDRLIHLTNKRMNSVKYSQADTYAKKFYRLNMFMLLKIKGIEGLEEEINNEKATVKKRIEEVQSKHFKEEMIEEDELPWAFGVNVEKKPKKEIPIDIKSFANTFFDKTEVHHEPSSIAQVHREPDIEQHESTIKEVRKVDNVNEELEYLKKFKPRKKADRTLDEKEINILKKPLDKNKGYIDIEDEELMKEWQPPTPVKEVQAFGEMFGRKLEVAEKIEVPYMPTFEEHGSMYLMELEKFYKSKAM